MTPSAAERFSWEALALLAPLPPLLLLLLLRRRIRRRLLTPALGPGGYVPSGMGAAPVVWGYKSAAEG